MHFLIGLVIVVFLIWGAIEYPKLRKALLITGGALGVFCIWAAWFLTARPS